MGRGKRTGGSSAPRPPSPQRSPPSVTPCAGPEAFPVSFAAALKTPVKPLGIRSSDWEVLMEHFQALQQENSEMRLRVEQLENRVQQLETKKLDHSEDTHELKQQVSQAVNQVQEMLEKMPGKVHKDVLENGRREAAKHKLRIGGLPPHWRQNEYSAQLRFFASTMPGIKWVSHPTHLEVLKTRKGDFHCVLSFVNQKVRDDLLRQSSALRGTPIWFAEELTPLQLRSKKDELIKVREARKAGKWAVYRGGQAIIRDFKTVVAGPSPLDG